MTTKTTKYFPYTKNRAEFMLIETLIFTTCWTEANKTAVHTQVTPYLSDNKDMLT